jgi:hypothetical protein
MRSFVVRYSDRAASTLATLRLRQRSAARRQKHDDACFLLEVELVHDADIKGWPYSANRRFKVIDEYPLRFVFWPDHPNVWVVDVLAIQVKWWHGLDVD